ncbi:MAG TPA: Ku protein [Rhizomicrobium sp.]|nr:Ku protein [Rhizomicrobium sp.]
MAARRAKRRTRPRRKRAARGGPVAHANDDAPQLSRRPVWEGHLKLSLVSCAVALFNATTRANDISFHLLNPRTNNRIRMIPTDPEEGPVERSGLVKGYEIERNRYVVIEPEELDAVKLETTHTLDIERFVDAGEIDRLYWNDPFYLLPGDDDAAEAYSVIRDAMAKAGAVALGRVTMHARERLMAVEARGRGLIAFSLRTHGEVVDPGEAFGRIPPEKPQARMIQIAEKIIAQLSGPFEPEDFEDRYKKALRDLIRRKERGRKPVTVEPPQDTNVVDLMEALKHSLRHRGGRRRGAR